MKKTPVVLIALALVLSITSCGEKEPGAAEDGGEEQPEARMLTPTETVEVFLDSVLVDAGTYVGLLSSNMRQLLQERMLDNASVKQDPEAFWRELSRLGIEASLQQVENADIEEVMGWFFEIVQNAPGAEEDLDEDIAELQKITVQAETVDGDEATVITVHADYEGDGNPLALVKEDGKWRINNEGLAMAWAGYVGKYQLYY